MVLGIDASRVSVDQKTGVETYAYNLIRALKKIIPPQVRIILYSNRSKPAGLGELSDSWQWKQLGQPAEKLWTHRRLLSEIWHQPPTALFVPAHVLPIICPTRQIITIHDVAFEERERWYSRAGRAYLHLMTKIAAGRADKIFCISEFTKSELMKRFGARPERITVTPLGVDALKFKPVAVETIRTVLSKYNIHQPYLFYLGRLEAKKNVSGLLEAFEIVSRERNDLFLVLAGAPGFGFEKIERKLQTLSCRARIKILGYLKEDDLPALYSGAAAFVFPSWYEGFGLPLLEAASCGTPVVASNRAAIPEVAGEAACLVNPSDAEDIAAGVERVLSDEAYRQALRTRGLERVKNFSWEKTAQKTWETIETAFFK